MATATCQHGTTGFCWDDATPEQAGAFESIFDHSYSWAINQGLNRDDAEVYASARAHADYDYPFEDRGCHSLSLVPDLAAKYPHVN